VVAVALAVVGVGFWALQKPAGHASRRPYCAAFVTGGALVVFPFNAPKVNVRLPFVPGRSAYSPDGRSLYADRQYPDMRPGLLRIELKSGQVTAVPGSSGLFAHSLAISPDEGKIVISGQYRNGERMECGIFELETATGTVRTVPVSTKPDCDYLY
jgi:DNA-binding beta-propeller fold protein YncE